MHDDAVVAVALTIAGSDPSGGAGVQADLRTFHQHGVHGTTVLTLVTAQDTRGLGSVRQLDTELVAEQLDLLLADLPPAAAKTGALGSRATVELVAERAARHALVLVVDPVCASTFGAPLLDRDALASLRERLLPQARLLTPNLAEASLLSGREVRTLAQARDAARALFDLGPRAVLVKGGHIEGDPVDVLFEGRTLVELPSPRVVTRAGHGTGCVLSAAICARLARGEGLEDAVRAARRFVVAALEGAPPLGAGRHPLDLFVPPGTRGDGTGGDAR